MHEPHFWLSHHIAAVFFGYPAVVKRQNFDLATGKPLVINWWTDSSKTSKRSIGCINIAKTAEDSTNCEKAYFSQVSTNPSNRENQFHLRLNGAVAASSDGHRPHDSEYHRSTRWLKYPSRIRKRTTQGAQLQRDAANYTSRMKVVAAAENILRRTLFGVWRRSSDSGSCWISHSHRSCHRPILEIQGRQLVRRGYCNNET